MRGVLLKVSLTLLLFNLAYGNAYPDQTPSAGGKINRPLETMKRKTVRRSLSQQEAFRLRKIGEKESKRHDNEMRRREYEMMLESRRQGVMQRQKQSEKGGVPVETQ